MFHITPLVNQTRYLIVDYDHFSLTVGLLTLEKHTPIIQGSVRRFFTTDERVFHPDIFEKYFLQACELLGKQCGDLPKEVALFIDHPETIITSNGYTFTRENSQSPLTVQDIYGYTQTLFRQSQNQAERLWTDEHGYTASDRRLFSAFLSQCALDKQHQSSPLGKSAAQVSLRCLFLYGSHTFQQGLKKALYGAGFELLTIIPMPCVFLNTLSNSHTFFENHLHIHLGYDTTSVVLHLGKRITEVQMIPLGWRELDTFLESEFSPLERESLLLTDRVQAIQGTQIYARYKKIVSKTLLILFERFGLQWSFSDVSLSSS
jgi:hypothetical protein